jgi:hypothetical protein
MIMSLGLRQVNVTGGLYVLFIAEGEINGYCRNRLNYKLRLLRVVIELEL